MSANDLSGRVCEILLSQIKQWGVDDADWRYTLEGYADSWRGDTAFEARIVETLARYAQTQGAGALERIAEKLDARDWPSLAKGLRETSAGPAPASDFTELLRPLRASLQEGEYNYGWASMVYQFNRGDELDRNQGLRRAVIATIVESSRNWNASNRRQIPEQLSGWGLYGLADEVEEALNSGSPTASHRRAPLIDTQPAAPRKDPFREDLIRAGALLPNDFKDENYPQLSFKPSDRTVLHEAMGAYQRSGSGFELTGVLSRLRDQGVFADAKSRDEAINVMAGLAHRTHRNSPEVVHTCMKDAGLSEYVPSYDQAYERRRPRIDPNYRMPSSRSRFSVSSDSSFGGGYTLDRDQAERIRRDHMTFG